MAVAKKSRFLRLVRIYFRRFRITVWAVVLALICVMVYLTQVGLPDFIKNPIVQKLRERGVELRFTRLRLNWYGAIVAQNVEIGNPGQPLAPSLTAGQAVLQLRHRSLAKLQLHVESIALRRGRLVWNVAGTNEPPREVSLENLQTDLRFLPGDEWSLDNFNANFGDARLHVAGRVTHASAVRDWKSLRGQGGDSSDRWRKQVKEVLDIYNRIHFTSPPQLDLDIRGDALQPLNFSIRMSVVAPDAETPWGVLAGGRFTALFRTPKEADLPEANLTLDADSAELPQAEARQLHLEAHVAYAETLARFSKASVALRAATASGHWNALVSQRSRFLAATNFTLNALLVPAQNETNTYKVTADLSMERGNSTWASLRGTRIHAEITKRPEGWIPAEGRAVVDCELTESGVAITRGVHVELSRLPNEEPATTADPGWGFWLPLAPYKLNWRATVSETLIRGVEGGSIVAEGSWHPPQLTVTNFSVGFYTGKISGNAGLNVSSRLASARVETTADPHKIGPILPNAARRWLSQFDWKTPPSAQGDASITLPSWTNSAPNWKDDVLPTLYLNGQFTAPEGGSYRGMPVETAQSHFMYSNSSWHLPDLFLTRPEGSLKAEHRANDVTKQFSWKFQSTLDPRELTAVFGTNTSKVKELLSLTTMPNIEAELTGRSRDNASVWAHGRVSVSNFTFRSESFSSLAADAFYTNGLLTVIQPEVTRGVELLKADSVVADFGGDRVFITNGFSTAEPLPVARAIGSNVARAIMPYRFGVPPTIEINGAVPLHGEDKADILFAITGGPFRWQNFNVSKLKGNLLWRGSKLLITDVITEFYGGQAKGYAAFTFAKDTPAQYEFAIETTDTLLQPFMAEVFTTTNKIDGFLSGNLVVTHGSAADWQAWDGYGSMKLRDGFLWDLPLFGVFSPILNGISPGLGSSRANAGQCSFTMTNGVMHTDDLEIHSSGMRLQYKGTVDLHARVNLRVEAELLRDMKVVGPLVSTLFWPVSKMFEYKVTGTLGQPKLDPVYIVPKLMQLPTLPFRILRGLLPEDTRGKTNAPPEETRPK